MWQSRAASLKTAGAPGVLAVGSAPWFYYELFLLAAASQPQVPWISLDFDLLVCECSVLIV